MNSTVVDYLNDFYNDPLNVEEFKIAFLKNHFYPKVNIFLNCKINNLKIGATKNKKIIWFHDIKNPNLEIIYAYKDEKYYIHNRKEKLLNEIILEDLIEKGENISLIKEKVNIKTNIKTNNLINNLNKIITNRCIIS
jgi:hypothetical protein